uniref:Uncharacterized protein n=1 Tax=Varanus komodoensis TaxID=61221 RepID=A0A8D2LEZ1_VARKO
MEKVFVMSSFLLTLFTLPFYVAPIPLVENMFLQLANDVVATTNLSDCWLCTHTSHHNWHWPLIPFQFLNYSDWANISVHDANSTITKDSITSPILLDNQALWPPAPYCIKAFYGSADVGAYPNCSTTLVLPHNSIDWDYTVKDYGSIIYLPTCPCVESRCICSAASAYFMSGYVVDNCTASGVRGPWPDNVTRWRAQMSLPDSKYLLFRSFHWQRTVIKRGGKPENYTYGLPPGVFFVCGTAAYKVLPPFWHGTCTLASLGPLNMNIQSHDAVKRATNPHLYRRNLDSNTRGFLDFVGFFIPSLHGVFTNLKLLNISKDIERLANVSKIAIKALQTEVDSLAKVVVQNRLALDYLFLRNGGVCAWLNQSCCFYVNQSGVIE